ncbi:protein ENHANCED PSEUDOMONAS SUSCEPTIBILITY 1-like [Alnus glutinosa]|uniref:protein ENHANCED PSEUDOMONAS SUSCEPTIBILITY 1-like n=1 Tax=Alnus glutinosa TaxID=3517 RepID=UPI002D772D73|nr:protein ENHANCED PSEUDOMONAS SUSCEPTIBILITY 1-like [Alnus glutinosa]
MEGEHRDSKDDKHSLRIHEYRLASESTPRIELTPWDLKFLVANHIQKGLLFLKPTPSQEEKLKPTLIDHLKTSLPRTLDIFYPLAGRLVMVENDDETASFFVDYKNIGAQFVYAKADGVAMSGILQPLYVPDVVNSFFLMNRVSNYEGVSKPLLAMQVTKLVDGIFIGCTLNHSVADGTSFCRFFNNWSGISKGSDPTSLGLGPPIILLSHLDGIIDLPIRFPFHERNDIQEKSTAPPLKQRFFHFSKEKIQQLKAKANAEMSTDKISSFQAVLAYLWRSMVRNCHLNADEEVCYFVSMGMRQRLQPPLPEEYLGNTIQSGNVTATAGDLEHGLGWAAWQINKTIASQTTEEGRKYVEDWIKTPKFIRFSSSSTTILLTGSSPWFNAYGNDFGWGRPVAVRSGAAQKLDGKLNVLPGKEEGSIDFEACFLPQTLKATAEDADCMEAVAT